MPGVPGVRLISPCCAQLNRYKEQQAQFAAEKALWEEQQGVPAKPAAGLPRAAFQLGSVFGSMRNAILAGASSHGASASGAVAREGPAAGDGEAEPRLPPMAVRLPVRALGRWLLAMHAD
jgi:hypothetical protein